MAAIRPTLYREVLTPALHRRFTSSALLVLAFCYIEAVLLAEKSSFIWTWFPLGPAGIRALLLFLSALVVFVLRVATLHIGVRASDSPATSLTQMALQFKTLQVFACYLFSAWWFSEVYVWSASTQSNLGWITQGKTWEPKGLNERPIYLRSVFLLLGVAQGVLHLYYDYDDISLSITPSKSDQITQQSQGVPAWFGARWDVLKPMFAWNPADPANSLLHNIILRTVAISLASPFLYGIFIRRTAWKWSLAFASLLWEVPASRLSYIPPHYPSLIYRSMSGGLLLVFLWQSSNSLFTSYVARQPIKIGQPLSNTSKDPSGTLLNGLKSKKQIANTYALWELSLITSDFPERRKAIYTDIDRPSGPAWTQIASICLSNIDAINGRINTFLNPPASSAISHPSALQQAVRVESLPRISAPLRQENILSNVTAPLNSLEKIESNIGSLAKAYGQSPSPGTLKIPYSPQAKAMLTSSGEKLLSSPAKKLLTSAQQEQLSTGGFRGMLNEYVMQYLRSNVGQPFRQTFSRRISAAVLGSPYSNIYSILAAIKSLSALATASLKEDPYGRVSKDVPTIIRTYTSTIQSVEAFCKNLPPHWTDVEFQEEDRQVEHVDAVVSCLKDNLRSMLEDFGPYAGELGLGETEVRVAKRVSGGFEDEI